MSSGQNIQICFMEDSVKDDTGQASDLERMPRGQVSLHLAGPSQKLTSLVSEKETADIRALLRVSSHVSDSFTEIEAMFEVSSAPAYRLCIRHRVPPSNPSVAAVRHLNVPGQASHGRLSFLPMMASHRRHPTCPDADITGM